MDYMSSVRDTDVAFFIFVLMLVFAIDRYIRVFFDKRRTPLAVLILSYSFYVIFITLNSRYGIPRASLLIWFVSLIIISLNYESTWKKRFIAASSILAVTSIIDVGTAFFFGIYFNYFFADLSHTILSQSVSVLGIFLAALLLQKFKNLRKEAVVSPIIGIAVLLIPLSSQALAIMLLIYAQMPSYIGIMVSSIIFGINVLTFFMHDHITATYEYKLKSVAHSQEKEYYLSQCQLMQESMEQVKSARHDMKSHLATVKGISVKIQANEITAYTSNLLEDLDESEIYCETGNIVFDSIINFKLKNARQENIKVDIRLHIPPKLNIEMSDIAIILGNLLDNALDAVSGADEKMIKIDIEYNKESLFIQVENTFDGVVKYAEKTVLEKKRITTRKRTNDHGHGLKNIKRSIEKYNGHIDITHEDKIFSVTILLYTG